MQMTTAQKNHISGSLFTSSCGSLGFCFLRLKLCEQKLIKCFSMNLKKYCEPILVLRRCCSENSKKVFSVLRSNLTDNFKQMLSSKRSSRQLLY